MTEIRPACPVIYKQLRQNCPIAQSDAHGGFKVVTRYRDVVTIAKDTGRFSSAHDIEGTRNGYQGVTIPPESFAGFSGARRPDAEVSVGRPGRRLYLHA